MQYFVARYLYNLVNEEMTRFALSFLILGTLSFSAASMCIRFSTRWFWRQFYKLSAYWMGTVFILFTVTMGERLLNLFLPIPKLLSLLIISVTFILVFTQAIIGGNKLELKIVKTPSKKAKMPIRFVQLSDIHLGAINRKEVLQRLVSQTNILNPEFIVITGDLFDGNCDVEQDILEPLNSFVAPTYFVTGNHDYYQGVDAVRKQLSKTKV
ncbi:MAG TPA: metallophosphoesterase, partial [Acidobacteriota bacterium]|nr:metallophosphoesterase [Acidobacteriota bacterium]